MTNKKQHRTSLKDLARELGVSIATESRATQLAGDWQGNATTCEGSG